MDTQEVSSRRCVLRAYGTVCFLQLLLGVVLIVSGLVALKFTRDEFSILRPPYFMAAFVVGMLMIGAGVCTLYIYLTEAPMLDYYFLDATAIKRIRQSVTSNTVASIVIIFVCLFGLYVCVVFALGPCDTDTWISKCSFRKHPVENRMLAMVVTTFLGASGCVSLYSAIMSCVHGWVFDFEVVNIKPRERINTRSSESRRVSGFQQVNMFEIEGTPADDEGLNTEDGYKSTSSFKQANEKRSEKRKSHHEYNAHAQHQHVTSQHPPPDYVAVLNDPAMKKKLKERNSRLQDL